jgi:hypothetical protein
MGSNADWFAKKLGQQPQQPQTPAPTYVAPQPATYVQPQQPQYPPSQQATPQALRCPGCGSGNYGGATPESRKRCYDCGYPIQQSGSGVGKGYCGRWWSSSRTCNTSSTSSNRRMEPNNNHRTHIKWH